MAMNIVLERFNIVLNKIKARIGPLGREREAYKVAADQKFGEIYSLIANIEGKIGVLKQHTDANEALKKENERFNIKNTR